MQHCVMEQQGTELHSKPQKQQQMLDNSPTTVYLYCIEMKQKHIMAYCLLQLIHAYPAGGSWLVHGKSIN